MQALYDKVMGNLNKIANEQETDTMKPDAIGAELVRTS
jgi:hypothetical protein